MIPKRIGRYEIKAELGRGGMATVYRGHDPRFKRDVAIKVLPREFLHDPQFRARFEREAEVIAALEHPAIVPVYDYGEDRGQPYIVMRMMTGGSLADRLRGHSIPLVETARVFHRLAPALDRAHSKGIIHRDLKPGNILFDDDDNPYISDFGIAKLSEATSTFTGSGVVGTPAYMSPEQARGEKQIDGRSDIYAIGVIIFEMLTGKAPYQADTPMGVVVKHITEPVPHILEAKTDLPSTCDDLIQRAMAKRPAERFNRAVDMAKTLEIIARDAADLEPPRPDDSFKTAVQADSLPLTLGPTPEEMAAGELMETASAPAQTDFPPLASVPTDQTTLGEVVAGGTDRVEAVPSPPELEAAPIASAATVVRTPLPQPISRPAPNLTWVKGLGGIAVLAAMILIGVIAIIRTASTSLENPPTQIGAVVPGTGQIAFVSERNGNPEIYTMKPDGTGLTRITNNPAQDFYPAWSTDGRLAFASNRTGNFEIYLNDSSGLTQLTNNPADDLYPAWSPDGKLAFASNRDGDFEIYLNDNSGLTQVTNNPADDLYPAWSCDGLLAFASNRDGDFEIYINDNSGLTQLTNNPADDLYPAWSCNGKLAFASNRDGDFEIYINDNSGLTTLTDNPAEDIWPAWSADGNQLAFASNRYRRSTILLSSPTGLSQITETSDNAISPAWRP